MSSNDSKDLELSSAATSPNGKSPSSTTKKPNLASASSFDENSRIALMADNLAKTLSDLASSKNKSQAVKFFAGIHQDLAEDGRDWKDACEAPNIKKNELESVRTALIRGYFTQEKSLEQLSQYEIKGHTSRFEYLEDISELSEAIMNKGVAKKFETALTKMRKASVPKISESGKKLQEEMPKESNDQPGEGNIPKDMMGKLDYLVAQTERTNKAIKSLDDKFEKLEKRQAENSESMNKVRLELEACKVDIENRPTKEEVTELIKKEINQNRPPKPNNPLRPAPITGTNTSCSLVASKIIEGKSEFSYIYAGIFDKNVTPVQLADKIKENGITPIEVMENARNNEGVSFKIKIKREDDQRIREPEIWAKGIVVRTYRNIAGKARSTFRGRPGYWDRYDGSYGNSDHGSYRSNSHGRWSSSSSSSGRSSYRAPNHM